MAGVTYPQRLYYNANVFRRTESSHNRQQEFYQAGVELLGTQGWLADAEVLLLLADCLNQLSLSRVSLILGEAGITRSLLSPFHLQSETAVRSAISRPRRYRNFTLSDELRSRARMTCADAQLMCWKNLPVWT